MRSPFRDDDKAAAQTLEELWPLYEDLSSRVARAEQQVARVRAERWTRALRVGILGLTFGAACFVGYYSSSEDVTACDHEAGWL